MINAAPEPRDVRPAQRGLTVLGDLLPGGPEVAATAAIEENAPYPIGP